MVAGSANTGEEPEERSFDNTRTAALSDGVFAIALTLLVLSISAPMLPSGHHGELARRLLDREPESFSLSVVVRRRPSHEPESGRAGSSTDSPGRPAAAGADAVNAISRRSEAQPRPAA